jgi:hypothetical protein
MKEFGFVDEKNEGAYGTANRFGTIEFPINNTQVSSRSQQQRSQARSRATDLLICTFCDIAKWSPVWKDK